MYFNQKYTNTCRAGFLKSNEEAHNAGFADFLAGLYSYSAATFILPSGGIKIGSTLRDNASHRLIADPAAQTHAPPAGFTAGRGADG